jgi:hypothetical protein
MQPRQPAGAAVLRPEKTEAIIAAFFAELGQNGYPGLTMDRVAETRILLGSSNDDLPQNPITQEGRHCCDELRINPLPLLTRGGHRTWTR